MRVCALCDLGVQGCGLWGLLALQYVAAWCVARLQIASRWSSMETHGALLWLVLLFLGGVGREGDV